MTKQHQPPFPPVATRKSAATAAATTTPQTTNPYPGLRTIRGGYMSGVAPMRNIAQQEMGEEDEGFSSEEPPKRRPTTARRIDKNPLETRVLPQKRTRFHPLMFVGIGLFIMIIGWLSFSALSSWWSGKVNDWTYGNPRTFQTDFVVGHGDSAQHPSHFLALNLHGQILVIEIPGGDARKAKIYIAPTLFGAGQDFVPVTLSFEDCDGNGDPDLNIHIQGSDKTICFVNNGKTFVPTSGQ